RPGSVLRGAEAARPNRDLGRHRSCCARFVAGGRAGTMGSPAPRPRAAIVVTGSELVRGERSDLNGPFLAQETLSLGLEPARITIVGDRPDELKAALVEALAADLCLVSGGLGPTHDD